MRELLNKQYRTCISFTKTLECVHDTRLFAVTVNCSRGERPFDRLAQLCANHCFPALVCRSLEKLLGKHLVELAGSPVYIDWSTVSLRDDEGKVEQVHASGLDKCRSLFAKYGRVKLFYEKLDEAHGRFRTELRHARKSREAALEELQKIQEEERSLVAGDEADVDTSAVDMDTQETLKRLETRQQHARKELVQLHDDKAAELRRAHCLRFVDMLQNDADVRQKLEEALVHVGATKSDAAGSDAGDEDDVLASVDNDELLENGLSAYASGAVFTQEQGGDLESDPEGGRARAALSSAFKLGKSVAAPWVGYLPESLSLLSEYPTGEGFDKTLESPAYTSSCRLETYVGTQHKVLFTLEVVSVLRDIWYGLEQCATTTTQYLSHGTTCLLLRQRDGDKQIPDAFNKLLQATPELYFKDYLSQLSDISSKDSDVCITKHSGLGLGVCAVFHVNENSSDFSSLGNTLGTASRLKFRHAIVPLRQWLEDEGMAKRTLDPKLVGSVFKAVKRALFAIAHRSQMSHTLTKVSFVLNSSIPHIDVAKQYAAASKGVTRGPSEPFIARDDARVAKAGQLLGKEFGVSKLVSS